MAFDMYMILQSTTTTPVTGEGTLNQYYQTIPSSAAVAIRSFSLGAENPTSIGSVSGGAGAGRITFKEATIEKSVDLTSPPRCTGFALAAGTSPRCSCSFAGSVAPPRPPGRTSSTASTSSSSRRSSGAGARATTCRSNGSRSPPVPSSSATTRRSPTEHSARRRHPVGTW